jgi:hypothetical protein
VHTIITLVSNVLAFFLLREQAAEIWIWPAIMASYVSWFTLLMLQRYGRGRPLTPAERLLWSMWIGHLLACITMTLAYRIAAGSDYVSGFTYSYLGHAALNTLLFFVTGSLYAGIAYGYAAAWAVTTVIMGLAPEFAPLEYAVLIAMCSLLSGLYLRSRSRQSTANVSPVAGASTAAFAQAASDGKQ